MRNSEAAARRPHPERPPPPWEQRSPHGGRRGALPGMQHSTPCAPCLAGQHVTGECQGSRSDREAAAALTLARIVLSATLTAHPRGNRGRAPQAHQLRPRAGGTAAAAYPHKGGKGCAFPRWGARLQGFAQPAAMAPEAAATRARAAAAAQPPSAGNPAQGCKERPRRAECAEVSELSDTRARSSARQGGMKGAPPLSLS